jgi:hypothetical protein
MRLAVVGAGLAGLAAARDLVADGHEVVVVEKSRGLGGRLAARRAEGTVLDHGSPVISAPPDTALRRLVDALPADDRVDLDEGIAFSAGATRMPKLIAEGLDVLLGVRLAALRPSGGGFERGDERGNTHGRVDGVVVTAPAPQAADLLERSPEGGDRVALLRGLSCEPAVMLLLGAEAPDVRENRRPLPRSEPKWPTPTRSRLDELDREVLASLPDSSWGASPAGWWPTTNRSALRRLRWFVAEALPRFGPFQDAMSSQSWHLAHSLLSSSLNLGLLLPDEVCDAVDDAYRAGDVPIASAEGLVRQVIGWREYVWGLYWLWGPGYEAENRLDAKRKLPPVYVTGRTRMRCVSHALESVERYGWTHHIQRLMLLGNLGLLAGVRPHELVDWFWRSFVDGGEWVMVPNVVGMALHADGGRMATKPYAGGGNYVDRMSDYCGGCHYDPRRRVGAGACPFTTLYWDFLARHSRRFGTNRRMAQQVRALDRLGDLPETRARAREVLALLDEGTL